MITKQKYAGNCRAIVWLLALTCVGSGLAFAQSAAPPPLQIPITGRQRLLPGPH